jgi:hypothetical protein
MSSSSAVAVAARAPIIQERIERVFYLLAGCLLLVVVAMGFQKFYLHGRASTGGEVTQQIVPLVFVHGIAMSAWIIAFITQSSLIVSGNRRLHMTLGIAGMGLAVFLVIAGVTTAIASVHYNPDGYKDLWSARRFLSFMLTNILGFGILAATGLRFRGRPEIHRPMMLLATLFVAAPAGFFRIPFISGPVMAAIHTIFAPWVPMLILGVFLVLLKRLMTRSWDQYFVVGLAAIIMGCVLQFFIANSAWWYHVAGWVTA